MKPADFDSTRKYPLLFYVYGGPATPDGAGHLGPALLCAHSCSRSRATSSPVVDNRGTPAPLGRTWRKAIYGQMGVLETRPGGRGARAGERPYVDPTRIGIWGWSNGGFMSLNVLFQQPDLYRTAVAVAPVTHWALYDNVYTERYNGLHRPTTATGYDRGSPLTYVDSLRGDLLRDPRQRRRQRALPEHRDPDQRAGRGEQAVRDAWSIPTGPTASARARTRSAHLFGRSPGSSTAPHGRAGEQPARARRRGTRAAHGDRRAGPYIRNSPHRRSPMTYEDIVALLGYAGGHEQTVRITTTDADGSRRHSDERGYPHHGARGLSPSRRQRRHRDRGLAGRHRGGGAGLTRPPFPPETLRPSAPAPIWESPA